MELSRSWESFKGCGSRDWRGLISHVILSDFREPGKFLPFQLNISSRISQMLEWTFNNSGFVTQIICFLRRNMDHPNRNEKHNWLLPHLLISHLLRSPPLALNLCGAHQIHGPSTFKPPAIVSNIHRLAYYPSFSFLQKTGSKLCNFWNP